MANASNDLVPHDRTVREEAPPEMPFPLISGLPKTWT